jgi:hypothetical protein
VSDQRSDTRSDRPQRDLRQRDGKATTSRKQAAAEARRRIELLNEAQALGEILLDPWEDD